MSVKRQAAKELNQDNWNEEDEREEMGTFKSAPQDVIEKRVIRTAKRRAPISGEEPKKSAFSGFGFNKTQPSSFDFLSKLTNGNNSNGSPNTAETSSTSNLFTNKPTTSSSTGIFSIQTSPKSPFGTMTMQSGSLFGAFSSNTTATSVFGGSKTDSAVIDSPFKSQAITNTSDHNTDSTKLTFGNSTTSVNVSKSPFSSSSTSPIFEIKQGANTATIPSTVRSSPDAKTESVSSDTKTISEDSKDPKKIKYYSKLRGLNESVLDWIKMHVEKTPLCILTPIFKDYDKHLKEIQNEYNSTDKDEASQPSGDNNPISEIKSGVQTLSPKPAAMGDKGSSLFKIQSPTSKPIFGTQNNISANKPTTFSFGINTSASTSSTMSTPGFSFGVTVPSQPSVTATSSPFSLSTNTTTTNASSFSFGGGKPFNFNSNIQQNTDKADDTNEEDDAPPKVEFTPIAEENSIYDKRCKLFVKKDGNFVDKGVGTLYIKKIEETGKHQLLIRANTNLGTIVLNLILASTIPTQRMGKNNVMLICIPTPDSNPPPTPVLIRVKTSEEADELLETLNKYKS